MDLIFTFYYTYVFLFLFYQYIHKCMYTVYDCICTYVMYVHAKGVKEKYIAEAAIRPYNIVKNIIM